MSIRRPKQRNLIERHRRVVFRAVLLIRGELLILHRVQRAGIPKRSEPDGVA